MLVLDDLHWANRPSLLLLEYVARELPDSSLLIVGTCRDMALKRHHPISDTLGELARMPQYRRLSLQGLDREEVAQLMEVTTGSVPLRGIVEAVHVQTEGNPFFVKEVVNLLDQESEPGRDASETVIQIPESVRETIGRRLNRLSEQCHEMLTVASVIGREFTFQQLANLIESVSEDGLLDFLEEALAGRVIEEVVGLVGRYRFTHVLIQHTLLDELSTVRQVRMHARIAQSLENLYGSTAGAHATELVHHFIQAVPVLGHQKAVHYSLAAGEQALSVYAFEDALRHFQNGLDGKEGQEMDFEAAELCTGLGKAQGALGQVHQAWSTLGRAFNYYFERGHVEQAVAVAEYPLFYAPGLSNVTRMVTEALKLVPPHSPEAGRLLSRYGLLINLESGDYQRAQQALQDALASAQLEGNVALEIQALTNSADADFYHLHWSAVLENSVRAIKLANGAHDIAAEVWPRYLAASALWAMGTTEDLTRHAADMLEQARRLRNQGYLVNALVLNAGIAHVRGDWPAARGFIQRAVAVAPNWFWVLACRALLEYETGNFDQGEVCVKSLLEEISRTPSGPTAEIGYAVLMPPLVARITGEINHFDIARSAAESVLSSPSVTPRIAWDVNMGLALVAIQEGDASAAIQQYQALRSTRGTALLHTSVDRVLGLLTHCLGEPHQAVQHLEEARSFCQRAGYRPEYAWSCYDYADVLLRRKAPGDQERSRELLEESLAISAELGMPPLMERTQFLKERTQSTRQSRAHTYPDGLTEREVEVLRLIAGGQSNREIGATLFISDRTVAQHVTSILNKTGTANRAEAAIYAARHGLVT